MDIDQNYYARKFESEDIERLYVYKNDPVISSFLGGFNTGMCREDIRRWIEHHNNHNCEYLRCVATRDDDQCVAQAGFYNIDHRARNAEFAIAIFDSSHRGKGLGRLVSCAFLRYGFEQLNFHRIYLTLLKSNDPALKLYESLGFISEGCQVEMQYKDGKYIDVLLMGLLRRDWEQRNYA